MQAGDTLSTIAGRTLGNAAAYDRIVAATNAAAAVDGSFATIESANRLAVGWKLCIPGSGGTQAVPAAAPAAPAAVTPAPAPVAENEGGLIEAEPFDGEALTIDYLREQRYPDQQLVIEQELAPGANYDRYIASYLSEGLSIDGLLTVPQGDAAGDRLAGDHLQPRLHPARRLPHDRALRGLRGRLCPQRLHRLPARLPRPRLLRG